MLQSVECLILDESKISLCEDLWFNPSKHLLALEFEWVCDVLLSFTVFYLCFIVCLWDV